MSPPARERRPDDRTGTATGLAGSRTRVEGTEPGRQLARRRAASCRTAALPCGCRDPWQGHQPHTSGSLSDRALNGWAAALSALLEVGATPVADVAVLRALWQRGGSDRVLADRVVALNRVEVPA